LENLDRRALPENIHERLAVVRARSEEILPQLEGKVNVAQCGERGNKSTYLIVL
jgi:hypothetical protein